MAVQNRSNRMPNAIFLDSGWTIEVPTLELWPEVRGVLPSHPARFLLLHGKQTWKSPISLNKLSKQTNNWIHRLCFCIRKATRI